MTRVRPARLAAVLALAIALGGCAGGNGTRITVLAAASLSDVFEDLAARYEAQHPGAEVELSFGGSSGLAAQILEGAPADVFASADEATMQRVVDAGLAADPVRFAANTLQLVVPAGNPGGVRGIADLADPSLVLAICDPQVPCGVAAVRLLELAGVGARPDTLEPDVRAVLTRVRLGEADAGLVYRTDAAAAGGEVEAIEVPEAVEVVNRATVAVLASAADPAAAEDWIAFLRSPDAQRILVDAGFVAP